MQQRALASSLTGFSMALGVALMILVIVIHEVTVEQFSSDAQGYHLIVGGSKGGDVQLVMNTVFHLGNPLYPIPYSYYKEFIDGRFAYHTKAAIPYCIGDSFHANGWRFRVIATTPDLFEKRFLTGPIPMAPTNGTNFRRGEISKATTFSRPSWDRWLRRNRV